MNEFLSNLARAKQTHSNEVRSVHPAEKAFGDHDQRISGDEPIKSPPVFIRPKSIPKTTKPIRVPTMKKWEPILRDFFNECIGWDREGLGELYAGATSTRKIYGQSVRIPPYPESIYAAIIEWAKLRRRPLPPDRLKNLSEVMVQLAHERGWSNVGRGLHDDTRRITVIGLTLNGAPPERIPAERAKRWIRKDGTIARREYPRANDIQKTKITK